MQVPVVMSTSLGQIPTVAVQQPPGTPGAAGHAALLANTSAISAAAAGNANTQQKVGELLLGPAEERVYRLPEFREIFFHDEGVRTTSKLLKVTLLCVTFSARLAFAILARAPPEGC